MGDNHSKNWMNQNETYITHPTFGLLYRVCVVEPSQEIFTTLYAQRLFFLVTVNDKGVTFEPKTRDEARSIVESRLRKLRRQGAKQEYQQLNDIYQRFFQ